MKWFLLLVSMPAMGGQVLLSWVAPTHYENCDSRQLDGCGQVLSPDQIEGYIVEGGLAGQGFDFAMQVDGSASDVTVPCLQDDTYKFGVRTVARGVQGQLSNVVVKASDGPLEAGCIADPKSPANLQ